jgi:hypothetical protein
MKIKKSELLALIKEEIMNEMDGLTMMDDPRDEEMERMVTTQMDDVISMLSNYLVTSGASSDPTRAASMGMDMLRDAGLAFPDQSALERMIAGDDGMMQEGVDAESMQVVADVMSLPVLIGLIYEKLKEMGAK